MNTQDGGGPPNDIGGLNLISSSVRSETLISTSGQYQIVCKLLTPGEWIDIWEEAAKYKHPDARELVTQIEALARCLIAVNGQPLVLTPQERELVKRELHVSSLTAYQEAAQILKDRFPIHAIQEIEAAADTWMREYYEKIGLLAKKKPEVSGQPISGSSFTSGSFQPIPGSES